MKTCIRAGTRAGLPDKTMDKNEKIREIRGEETRPLRQLVLRPDQKAEDLVYPGDDTPETYHAGVFIAGRLVSIATVYREAKPGEDSQNSWRLRGMATLPVYQGKGYGGALLTNCTEYIKSQGGSLLWCNAREKAVNFYKKSGFAIISDIFDIPGIGPHYVMEKQL
jgi:GNAT superfamily N-acetyltransferase